MNTWHTLYITDKTGVTLWHTVASPMATYSEICNLKRHIERAKTVPEYCKFLDIDSAVIMLDGTVYGVDDVTDIDNILKELGL